MAETLTLGGSEVPAVSPYAHRCPKCGALPTEPCWHLTRCGVPLMYPHWQRSALAKRAGKATA